MRAFDVGFLDQAQCFAVSMPGSTNFPCKHIAIKALEMGVCVQTPQL